MTTDEAPEDAPHGGLVRIEADAEGHVVEIVLDRPQALNAVSTAMAVAITDATARVAADPQALCRAAFVAGPCFCVGADLKERNGFTDPTLCGNGPWRAPHTEVCSTCRFRRSPRRGAAPGRRYELALSCDVIVAGDTATVGLPEVSVGVIPGGGGTQLLTRRVGWSRAASLASPPGDCSLPRRWLSGAWTRSSRPGRRDRALELARAIAANSPVGLRSPSAMRLGFDVDLATGLEVEDACWRAAFSGDARRGRRPSRNGGRPCGRVGKPPHPKHRGRDPSAAGGGRPRHLRTARASAAAEGVRRRRPGRRADRARGRPGQPRLVVLDLGLPFIDGLEVCRRMRAMGKTVPVLILTARADEVDTVVGLDAGADDYVTKPFRLAELLARVRPAAAQPHGGVAVERPAADRPRGRVRRGSRTRRCS